MKKYEFFEHTADAKFKAYGKSLEEAFANAALAMTSIMIEPRKIKPKIKKTIKVAGDDLKSLLYKFIEEFLYLLDTESFLTASVKTKISKKGDRYILDAEALGDKAQNYKTHGDVKAVTYNAMEINESEPVYVQVVVDI